MAQIGLRNGAWVSSGGSKGLVSSEALVHRRQEVSGTYTVDSSAAFGPDVVLGADTSAAAVTINLPSAAAQPSGRMLTIHDLGDAATNKVGISPDGSDTINGAVDSLPTAYAMEITVDYGAVTLVCDGATAWYTVFST